LGPGYRGVVAGGHAQTGTITFTEPPWLNCRLQLEDASIRSRQSAIGVSVDFVLDF
jgi:hypothetical protein